MIFDEEPPRKPNFEPGMSLDRLSIHELQALIGTLREEISRIEIEIARKSSQKTTAEGLFR